MFRKIAYLILVPVLSLKLCGCVAVVAAGAGGAGTVFWLEGKIRQELNAPMLRVSEATRDAMSSLGLVVSKTTIKEDISQIIAEYSDGRTIWIDIRPVSSTTSRIDIRVGIKGDKEASREILERIKRYL